MDFVPDNGDQPAGTSFAAAAPRVAVDWPNDCVLPRRQRLHTRRQFNSLWRQGRARRGRYCTIRLHPTADIGVPRFGFVVSKAVAKRATTRNLLKRRLRAISQQLVLPPADVVIYAMRPAATAAYSDLRQELINLLSSRPHATNRRSSH